MTLVCFGSISEISEMKVLATDARACSGHSENQSIVQQVTSDGNCRNRARKTSPIGLKYNLSNLKETNKKFKHKIHTGNFY